MQIHCPMFMLNVVRAFMMDRAMASSTGCGRPPYLKPPRNAERTPDWSIRGIDRIVTRPRIFSDHLLREHGDAVIAGFTELRSIEVKRCDRRS